MPRYQSLYFITILLILASLCHAATKPNVVLIFIDDLGYGDIGPFGVKDIPTPHLDQLAAEGVLTTAKYITNPPCCPSRCSLYMGQYAQRFGKYGMSRGLPIPEDRPTLAQFLSSQGYITGQIGKWDIGTRQQKPLNTGFNEVARIPPRKQYTEEEINQFPKNIQNQIRKKKGKAKFVYVKEDGTDGWQTDYDGDMAVDFITRHKDRPFFLYFSPEAVHSFSDEAPERLTSRTSAKPDRKPLAGAIASVDDQVGKILKVLEDLKLREETLVIFSSDNGPNLSEQGTAAPFRGGKGTGTQQEGWVRVPAIYSMPGQLPQGQIYEGMTATIDFYATIAALAGATNPEHLDGVDLFPYLKGEKSGDAHEHIYWLNNDPDDPEHRHLVAVRWKDWRLYRQKIEDAWQLFDLAKDPQETQDLSANYPEIVERLAAKHANWAKTLAPLGEIPKNRAGGSQAPDGYGWATAEGL
ncbi:MAG: sulfatase-like hydrolase/transferase [Verrucomicrobiota bacterium]